VWMRAHTPLCVANTQHVCVCAVCMRAQSTRIRVGRNIRGYALSPGISREVRYSRTTEPHTHAHSPWRRQSCERPSASCLLGPSLVHALACLHSCADTRLQTSTRTRTCRARTLTCLHMSMHASKRARTSHTMRARFSTACSHLFSCLCLCCAPTGPGERRVPGSVCPGLPEWLPGRQVLLPGGHDRRRGTGPGE
jgi:hypothetical protein